MLVNVSKLYDGISELCDGAGELSDGTGELKGRTERRKIKFVAKAAESVLNCAIVFFS